MQGSCGARSKFLQVNQDQLLSPGMLMSNECRSNPQLQIPLAVFLIFFSSLFYPKFLPEMTSIKRVGALFVEDNGPHHVVTLEAELPRALSKFCWKQMVRLGQPRRARLNRGTSLLFPKSFWNWGEFWQLCVFRPGFQILGIFFPFFSFIL